MNVEGFSTSDFHEEFNKRVEVITSLHGEDRELEITKLRNELNGIWHLLPPYQKQTYSQKLDALKVDDSQTKRFKFKSKLQKKKINNEILEQAPSTRAKDAEATKDRIIRIKDITASLKDIEHSVIVISVETSCILDNVQNSIVVIEECHQLRIHNTCNCVIFKSSGERDINCIIEDSTNLKFTEGFSIQDFNNLSSTTTNYEIVNVRLEPPMSLEMIEKYI